MIIFIIIFFIILYFILITPKILNKPESDLFNHKFYTHRGLHSTKDKVYENSITAFKNSIDKNLGFEFDIQLSKDNIPVVFHDFNLKRVCGIDKKINELNFSELKNLKLFDSNDIIPSLKEVLDLVDGRVPLIIEIKSNNRDTSICPIVNSYLDHYNGLYCIESFNPLILYWYRKFRPNIIRGQLSTKYIKTNSLLNNIFHFSMEYLLFNFLTKPNFIAYDYRYKNNLSLTLCKNFFKVPIVAYTISNELDLQISHDFFNSIIFENISINK